MSKENKTSAFEIPCSIFDIQNGAAKGCLLMAGAEVSLTFAISMADT
jgi:hypothetical protein